MAGRRPIPTLTQTLDALRLTPKGQLIYNNHPLSLTVDPYETHMNGTFCTTPVTPTTNTPDKISMGNFSTTQVLTSWTSLMAEADASYEKESERILSLRMRKVMQGYDAIKRKFEMEAEELLVSLERRRQDQQQWWDDHMEIKKEERASIGSYNATMDRLLEEDVLQKQQQQQQQQQQQLQQQQQQQQQELPEHHSVPHAVRTDVCHEDDTLRNFVRLNDIVMKGQEAGRVLSTHQQTKRLRIDIQRAVSITINSISDQSSRHTNDKFLTLSRLIQGEAVQIGRDTLSVGGHPEAVFFCQNLIAKKLVEQADSQVSANSKAAFPIAAIIISLMNHSELMKDLILAYFYIQCPYLIPYYPAKQEGQSTVDYFRSLGYKVSSSGEIEAQDLFVKRISGLTKLFATCLISQAVDRTGNTSFSIEHGWMWLVRVVSLRPHPATTATVLGSMLSRCGSNFIKTYTIQAYKMFQFLTKVYIPLIRNVGVQGDGGAIQRLELCLHELLIEFSKYHINYC